jgi:hypothetical protein
MEIRALPVLPELTAPLEQPVLLVLPALPALKEIPA